MKKNKSEFEIGQKVFIIDGDLNIVEKTIKGIIKEEKQTKYKLDTNSCGGVLQEDLFLTEAKADVKKQDFLDNLKFKVGDLIIHEQKEKYYSPKKSSKIVRIMEIKYTNTPYKIKSPDEHINFLAEKDIKLKVKNKFIENWGNIKELYSQFETKEKELNEIVKSIDSEFDELNDKLKANAKKPYLLFFGKPKFGDRFIYYD